MPPTITAVAASLDIPPEHLLPYGRDKAKVALDFAEAAAARPRGKVILVTSINPTAAGEGKTVTTIGLGDALNHIGKRAVICLRQPSMGPVFGMKGGATGGGRAALLPAADINLHFTGDFHAVGAAHNLLAALLDNHLHWGNTLKIDPRRIHLRRVIDMNDRALRDVVLGLGGAANGVPRQSGFDILVASEVMAILCLASGRRDLADMLARIVVADTVDRHPVTARDLKAEGAMCALLRDALAPNLVRSVEGSPALVHGGPFANIAHGCNSVIATRLGQALADYVVTEAGFGADLGAEKFIDIKCRRAGIEPAAAVVVVSARALKLHGGVAAAELSQPDPEAVLRGGANLARHIENLRKFGVPVVVAVNRFPADVPAELAAVTTVAHEAGVEAVPATHFADGPAGAADLARAVVALAEGPRAVLRFLYPDQMPLKQKIETVAREIYHAGAVAFDEAAERRLAALQQTGHGLLPVCMAKTQFSFTGNPALKGAPAGHTLHVREVRLAAGAGFVVAICGEIMTMPGLPRNPSAERIALGPGGEIAGV
jgi:formate--tetrahydrofolate ligase